MSDLLAQLEGVGLLDHTDAPGWRFWGRSGNPPPSAAAPPAAEPSRPGVHTADAHMGRSAHSMKLQTVRERHTHEKNTAIDGVEYGEVQKDGFTQIYNMRA